MHKIQYSKTNTDVDTSNQQLSENNEFENDDDFEIASFTIPFLISILRFEILNANNSVFPILSESSHQAVYLVIRNIRI